MTSALMIGAAFGALVGSLHAQAIYIKQVAWARARLEAHPVAVRAVAAYYALWTLLLWTLFGSYVLFLWIVAVVIYVCSVILRDRRDAVGAK